MERLLSSVCGDLKADCHVEVSCHFHLACHKKKVLPHPVQYVVSKRRVRELWPQNGHARRRMARLMPHMMAPTSTRPMIVMPTATGSS
jgi:hypothetical protein